jgi:hypothetical protein
VLLELPPMYERCTTIPSLRQIIEVCRLDDAMVGFASDTRHAMKADDEARLDTASDVLRDAAR